MNSKGWYFTLVASISATILAVGWHVQREFYTTRMASLGPQQAIASQPISALATVKEFRHSSQARLIQPATRLHRGLEDWNHRFDYTLQLETATVHASKEIHTKSSKTPDPPYALGQKIAVTYAQGNPRNLVFGPAPRSGDQGDRFAEWATLFVTLMAMSIPLMMALSPPWKRGLTATRDSTALPG